MQPEALRHKGFRFREFVFAVLLFQLPEFATEVICRMFLSTEIFELFRSARQTEPPGFVVAGHDNQGILRMPFRKIGRNFHRVVKAEYFPQHCTRIVAVTTPVDFAALDHHEKSILIVEQFNSFRSQESKTRCLHFPGRVDLPITLPHPGFSAEIRSREREKMVRNPFCLA